MSSDKIFPEQQDTKIEVSPDGGKMVSSEEPVLVPVQESAAREAESEIIARLQNMKDEHEEEVAQEEANTESAEDVHDQYTDLDEEKAEDLSLGQSPSYGEGNYAGTADSVSVGEFETAYLSMSDETSFPAVQSVDSPANRPDIDVAATGASGSSGGFGWLSALGVIAGVGAVGGIIAAASSGSSGSTGSGVSAGNNTISGTAVLGPVTGGVSVVAYDENGNQIGTGEITESGQYSIDVGSYTGPVLVQLIDTNDAASNYIDEAQNAPTDLTVDLRAVSVVEGSQTVVNITPLTEIAVREIGLGTTDQTNLSSVGVSGQQIEDANAAIASLFLGDGTQSIEKTEIAAVVDRNGNDTTASANTYGKVLAALSGADLSGAIAGGIGTEQTIAALSDAITNVLSGGGATWSQQAANGISARQIIEAGLQNTNASSGRTAIEDTFLDVAGIRTNATPVSTALTDQSALNYEALEYDVSGSFSDPDAGDTLSYSATGLPDGLTIDGATGLISGRPTTPGEYDVSVTATDGGGLTASESLVITVTAAPAIAEILSAPLFANAGTQVLLGIRMSEAVTVNTIGGMPTLTLDINGQEVIATYQNQGEADLLRFGFTAPSGDGNSLSVTAINLNGASVIGDVSGEVWAEVGQATDVLTIDNTAPTLQITSATDPVLASGSTVLTFDFSEAPDGFVEGDVSVTGGTLSGFQVDAQDPSVFTATFTPDAGAEGTATIQVDSFTDLAGNSQAAAASVNVAYDTVVPSVDDFDLDLTNGTVTIVFTEAPVGLTLDDITVTGGTLSNLVVDPSDDKVYTATFTEDLQFDGVFSASISSGLYQDQAGNPGLSGSAPFLGINLPTANGYVGAASLSALTISGEGTDGGSVSFVIFEKGNPSNILPASGNFTDTATSGSWARTVPAGTLGNGTYVIQAAISDANGHVTVGVQREFEVDVTLNDPILDTPPTLIEATSFDGQGNLTLTGTVDNDVQTVLISWDDQDGGTTDPSRQADVSDGTWTVTFSRDELDDMADGNLLTFKAEATDIAGNTAETTSSNIILELANQAPVSNDSETIDPLTVLTDTAEGTVILDLLNLDNSGATTDDVAFTDPDATTSANAQFTYSSPDLPSWLEIDSQSGEIRVAAGQAAPSSSENLSITVIATDGGGLTASRTIDINVVSAPTVVSLESEGSGSTYRAGQSFAFEIVFSENVTLTLNGGTPSVTLDINGETVVATYASVVSGNAIEFDAVAPIGNGSSITLTSINLDGATIVGQTSGQPLATDVTGQTTNSLYTFDNNPPSITTTALSSDENVSPLTFGTLAGTDNLGDLTWALASGVGDDDNSLFTVNPDGTIGWSSTAPDFETDPDTYSIRVQATDDAGNTSERDITINLNDVNEQPEDEGNLPSALDVVVNSSAGTQIADLLDLNNDDASTTDDVAFTDVDAGTNGQLTYSAQLVGGGSLPAWLEITSSGLIQVAAGQTAPATGESINIEITAEDGGGLTRSVTTTVNVVSPPVLTSIVDDVTNLDVRSDLVLAASENVSLTTVDGTYDITVSNDGGAGYRTETNDNTQTIRVQITGGVVSSVRTLIGDPSAPSYTEDHGTSIGDVLTIDGDAITINPFFDLDLANDYHVKVDSGLLVGATSGLGNIGVSDSTAINFATIDPNAATTVAAATQAQWFEGESLANSHQWVNVDDVGDTGSASPTNIGGLESGSYILVFKDWDLDGPDATERAGVQVDFNDGVRVNNFFAKVTEFGLDDLVYIDDQHNNAVVNLPEDGLASWDPGETAVQIVRDGGTGLGQGELVLGQPVGVDFSQVGAVDNPDATVNNLSHVLNGQGTSPVIGG